jgi:hypothetical protein
MKSFERWTIDEVEQYFHLTQTYKNPLLEAWLSASVELSEQERATLESLRQNASENIEFWNEEDLKMKFIAFVLALVPFDQRRYKGFLERAIKANINGEVVRGIVDYIVATGKAEPQRPFFFLQEYKPQRRSGRDPLAQVLTAMIVAREQDGEQRPMYGGYVIGRQWFFVILDEHTYTLSKAFDATDDDIFKIAIILKQMRNRIEEWLNEVA